MLEITALVVTAIVQTWNRHPLVDGDEVEVTWRHYSYDPEAVWFLEVEITSHGWWSERTRLLAG